MHTRTLLVKFNTLNDIQGNYHRFLHLFTEFRNGLRYKILRRWIPILLGNFWFLPSVQLLPIIIRQSTSSTQSLCNRINNILCWHFIRSMRIAGWWQITNVNEHIRYLYSVQNDPTDNKDDFSCQLCKLHAVENAHCRFWFLSRFFTLLLPVSAMPASLPTDWCTSIFDSLTQNLERNGAKQSNRV